MRVLEQSEGGETKVTACTLPEQLVSWLGQGDDWQLHETPTSMVSKVQP